MVEFFSKNLKFLREKNNFSQNKLGEIIGVNQTTIARWEDDNRTPTVDNAYDVSKAFGVSISDLLGKDLSKENTQSFDELELLFSKNKDILTEDDKDYIKFIIAKRKKEIDKEKGLD